MTHSLYPFLLIISQAEINKNNAKSRKNKDLTEAEEIKKRWHEYTEELYNKVLNDWDNHDGVITHVEPDILECGPYEALLQAKLVKVMEFQLSYFKS